MNSTPQADSLLREPVTLIVGMGRSGTTWLGELINHDHSYRVLFEPLHKDVAVHDLFRRGENRYLHPQDQDQILARDIADAFTRHYDSESVNQYNLALQNTSSYGVMIKEIRLVMLIPWLRVTFPDMPIVFIIRHPGAVVKSQYLRWKMLRPTLHQLTNQHNLMHDHLAPFDRDLRRISDRFQRQLLLWCATHYTLLRTLKPGQAHWVFYENLVLDPMNELKRIFDYLHRPFDAAAMAQLVEKPSRMTGSDANAETFRALDRWREGTTQAQLLQMQYALEMFGLDAIYNVNSTLPNANAAEALLVSDDRPRPNLRARTMWRAINEIRQLKNRMRGQ